MKRLIAVVVIGMLETSGWAQTEFPSPAETGPAVIAVVLGTKITEDQKENLSGVIFGTLLRQFAEQNQIEPTAEELELFIRATDRETNSPKEQFRADRDRFQEELKDTTLSEKDRKQKEKDLETLEGLIQTTDEMDKQSAGMENQISITEKQIARYFVQSWKVNKALHQRYGGRVIFQQAETEPLDAYRDFLKEQKQAGAFQILDKQYEGEFWRYFTNDAMHSFCSDEQGWKSFQTPWWEMTKPDEE